MRRTIAKPLILAATMLVLGAPPAQASSGAVIRDCSEDGVLDKHYSQRELAGALDNLPSDLDEYTDCRSVIRHAQLSGARGKGGKKRGVLSLVDTTAPPSHDEQRKLDQSSGPGGPVPIGGKPIRPGATGAPFDAAGLGTDLPSSVLAALIGLAAAMLSGTLFAIRRRWPGAWEIAVATVGAPIKGFGERLKRGISRFRR
jgi:hypothetical protein